MRTWSITAITWCSTRLRERRRKVYYGPDDWHLSEFIVTFTNEPLDEPEPGPGPEPGERARTGARTRNRNRSQNRSPDQNRNVKKEQKRPGRHTAIYRALMNMPEPGNGIRLAGGLSGKMEHGRPAAGNGVSGTEKSTGITSMLWVIWTQAGLRMETDRSISCMTSMIIVLALCIRAGTGSAGKMLLLHGEGRRKRRKRKGCCCGIQ